ncbi:hypothetical protein BDV93DRAFT_567018 [Ceratobasidium sp. AG-I]|nr:hypothetical protein BDV93DRAFT_567018 [Ceratobasidium sp. AG-I]
MLSPNATPSALRRRTITQGAKLIIEPLTRFAGVPGVHEFVKTAGELIVALKPRALQAPGVYDASAAAIVLQIVEIEKVVGDAMEQLNAMDDTVATTYLEKLHPFTEFLKETKAEIDQQQQRSQATKIALHRDMAGLLIRRENELRYRTLLLCSRNLQLETMSVVGQTVAQTHQTLVRLEAQFTTCQAQTAISALGSANGHQETQEDIIILKAEFGAPKSQFGAPKSQFGAPKPHYGAPKSYFGAPKALFGAPKS